MRKRFLEDLDDYRLYAVFNPDSREWEDRFVPVTNEACVLCGGTGCESEYLFDDDDEGDDDCEECGWCDGEGTEVIEDWEHALTADEYDVWFRQLSYLYKRYGTPTPRSIADYWLPAQKGT